MFSNSGRIICWFTFRFCGPMPMPICMPCRTNQFRMPTYIQPNTSAKKPMTM